MILRQFQFVFSVRPEGETDVFLDVVLLGSIQGFLNNSTDFYRNLVAGGLITHLDL